MNKLERIACLYLSFLNRPYYKGISFAEIKKLMPFAYQGDSQSARRKFERDKEELKKLGLEVNYSRYAEGNDEQIMQREHVYTLSGELRQLSQFSLSEQEYRSLALLILQSLAAMDQGTSDHRLLSQAATKLFYKRPLALEEADECKQVDEIKEDGSKHEKDGVASFAKMISEEFAFNEKHMETIHRALKGCHCLELVYLNQKEEKNTHELCPRGLISYKGRWCLLAYSFSYKEIRSFYVDRVLSARLSKRPYISDSKFDIRNYSLHPLTLAIHSPKQVQVEVAPEYEETFNYFLQSVRRRFSYYQEEENVFCFETSNLKALFHWMLHNANAVQKIGPQDVHQQFVEHLQEMKSLYQKASP